MIKAFVAGHVCDNQIKTIQYFIIQGINLNPKDKTKVDVKFFDKLILSSKDMEYNLLHWKDLPIPVRKYQLECSYSHTDV